MTSRKQKLVMEVNLLSEQRYLYNKFLKEDDVSEIPKLQVVPVGNINKYKVSLFQKLDNGNMKDIMTKDMLEKLNLKIEYADQESATIDVSKVTPDQLKNI
jgi:hypothetical protein